MKQHQIVMYGRFAFLKRAIFRGWLCFDMITQVSSLTDKYALTPEQLTVDEDKQKETIGRAPQSQAELKQC